MKTLKVLVATLLISGLVSSNTIAAPNGNSATGTADALVVTPITVFVSGDSLSFGGIVAGTAGTVTVDFSNNLSSVGVQTVVPSIHSLAGFGVAGDPNRAYTATIDPSVTMSNGTDSMTATLNPKVFNSSILDAGGNGTIIVGGTLTVAGTESNGAYSGTFNVSVDY